mmetsp:Transcript_18998/g.31073  ORF Transcript_18998/g.31073 Transcript_18998/m.31073 type:complete len:371 (-) Transcript_18998:13-1125(-)
MKVVCPLIFALSIASVQAQAPAPSSGCSSTSPGASGKFTMTDQGIERHYKVRVPESYDSKTPFKVVYMFHGYDQNLEAFLPDDALGNALDSHNYIAVAPLGLGSGAPDNKTNSWTFPGSADGKVGPGSSGSSISLPNATCSPNTTSLEFPSCSNSSSVVTVVNPTCSWTQCQVDDVQFVKALTTQIQNDYCIDTNNVFASGFSNGGMFTWSLAQSTEAANWFTAFGVICGLPMVGYTNGPGTGSSTPVLLITGNSDTTVPQGDWDDANYTTTSDSQESQYYYTGATAIMQSFAAAASCGTSQAKVSSFSNNTAFTSASGECRSYCDGSMPAVLNCRADQGHEEKLDYTSEMLLTFFDAHSVASTSFGLRK